MSHLNNLIYNCENCDNRSLKRTDMCSLCIYQLFHEQKEMKCKIEQLEEKVQSLEKLIHITLNGGYHFSFMDKV